MKTTAFSLVVLLCSLCIGSSLHAQKKEDSVAPSPPSEEEQAKQLKAVIDKIEKLGWTREGVGKLGGKAQVTIPKNYRFTGSSGTQQLLKMFDNVPSHNELGMFTTEGLGPWIIFEFDDVGYVKDDDKDELNADKLLSTLREGQEAGNEQRRQMGLHELELLGWEVPPRYNAQTHNLEWATRVQPKGGGGISINYNTRLLGRKGVMEVALICAPDEMQQLMPDYQAIMSGFKYSTGESYAEYRAGDKVAQYGLAALVAGGAAVAASKMGLFAKLGVLFAKLGKGAIAIVVAIGVGLRKLFVRLFGKNPQA